MLRQFLVKAMEAFGRVAVERGEAEQRRMDEETRRLSLYHFPTCPYCIRVRLVISKLKLKIELRDINRGPDHRGELVKGGGRAMVPCLRIENGNGTVQWMYESSDIIEYLRERFDGKQEVT